MKNKSSFQSDKTVCTHSGRDPSLQNRAVNPPVYHASTMVFESYEAYVNSQSIRPGDGLTYGLHGTPSSYAFETAIAQLEGGYRTRLCQSGLTACTATLLCYLSAGDHLLMTDSVYGPTRTFCTSMLKRLGVETTFYDPLIGADIAHLIRDNTKVIFTESPGSWTFEVQDIPAITKVAHEHNCLVILDNTWASPLYFKPFEHGVDVSVQAVTKYISGHSDLLMGSVTTTEAAYPQLRNGWRDLGLCAAPDDIYLASRGLRTLANRLDTHHKNGLHVAQWLQTRPEVVTVIHPALEGDPGHALWQRDFLGAASLFAFILKPELSSPQHMSALLDTMELFAMGYSWGGYESLLIPINPAGIRAFWPRPPIPEGQLLRIHVGLEDVNDLINDMERGFDRLKGV